MTRRSGLVTLSVIAHAVILCVIVVASVMAAGIIPTPFDRLTFQMQNAIKVVDIQLPASPPAHAPAPIVTVSPNAAPIEAPSGIAPETDITRAVPATNGLSNNDAGVLFGTPAAVIDTPAPPPPPPPPAEPVRVSSGVRAPTRISSVDPVYPLPARAARVEGVVIIEAVIGTGGGVESAKILRSVPLLDQAALDAVRQWRYTPTILNGVAVPVVMTVTVNFSLSGR